MAISRGANNMKNNEYITLEEINKDSAGAIIVAAINDLVGREQ